MTTDWNCHFSTSIFLVSHEKVENKIITMERVNTVIPVENFLEINHSASYSGVAIDEFHDLHANELEENKTHVGKPILSTIDNNTLEIVVLSSKTLLPHERHLQVLLSVRHQLSA